MIDLLIAILGVDTQYINSTTYSYFIVSALVLTLTFYVVIIRLLVGLIKYITKF